MSSRFTLKKAMQGPLGEREMFNSKWIGSPINHVEGKALYKSCETESGETVSVGDYVYMLPENPSHELYIARIEGLFEAEEAKCVQVRWLYRQTDLRHKPPSVPQENEVFYTNYYDCQLIQSIVGSCQVVQHTDDSTNPFNRNAQGNSAEVHICRYFYSEESGEFVEAVLTDSDHQYSLLKNDPEELADEDGNPDAKDLAHMLVRLERNMPPETATAQWPARRMAWMSNVKAVTNFEELKEVLLELENGYQIYTKQTSWRESIHALESSEMLLQYIRSFSHEMQLKANINNHANLEVKSLNKFGPSSSCREKHKRKRPTLLQVNSPVSKKQASEESFISKSIYKIEQRSLPPDAPPQLKNVRAALVSNTTKDYVTIAYPSMAFLGEYFKQSNSMSAEGASQERSITRCLFDQIYTSTHTMPKFDEEFSMTHKTAQRVLKSLIPPAEYLQQGHLETFWLIVGQDTASGERETQASKEQTCCNLNENVLSSPNQIAMEKHQLSEKNSPEVLEVYTLKKLRRGPKQDTSLDKNEKLSENESSSLQNECSSITQRRNVPMSLNDTNCVDPVASQHTHGTNLACGFRAERTEKSQNHEFSEENQGMVRWGFRKKNTFQYRCRGNTLNSHDPSSKEFYCEEKIHKQHQHEMAKTGLGSNANKRVAGTHTGVGKGKMLKVPKEMQGRWSSDRYKAAQLKLFEIMKDKGAVPGKPLLRPALRVEARKHIGDTGLLDHLLKHMTDTVINNGERFRRRHNSEGAMEYWVEDARLQEMRRHAGVDQYWIPPPGWKIGDAITNSKHEGMSQSQLKELKLLREDVEKLKSQLQSVCLQLEGSLLESKTTSVLDKESGFQPWKKIEESITKQAQEMKEELLNFRKKFECNNCSLQRSRSSAEKHFEAETDRTERYRVLPDGLDRMDASNNGDPFAPTQKNDRPALKSTQTSAMIDEAVKEKAYTEELCEMGKLDREQECDKGESNNSGDEITFFCKAATSCPRVSPQQPRESLRKATGNNAERRSPGSVALRRSPRSAERKAAENKENVSPAEQQGELMIACKQLKAFKGWKKARAFSHCDVLSANSANVAVSLR